MPRSGFSPKSAAYADDHHSQIAYDVIHGSFKLSVEEYAYAAGSSNLSDMTFSA